MKGPKRGSLRAGSLAAKISQMKPGEWMCLADQDPSEDEPTRLERHVQTLLFRSPALEGFWLTTERVLIVGQGLKPCRALKITREVPQEPRQ